MIVLSIDQREWLARIASASISRDDPTDPVPFAIATVLLDYQLINAGRHFAEGIARASWRVWEITPKGRVALGNQ